MRSAFDCVFKQSHVHDIIDSKKDAFAMFCAVCVCHMTMAGSFDLCEGHFLYRSS